MTKAFLPFGENAPKYTSRRHLRRHEGFAAFKSDGDKDPEDKRTEDELLEKIQAKFDAALATRATKEELQGIRDSQKAELKDFPLEALRAMADDKTGVMAKLAIQGLEITRMKNLIASQPEDKSIRSQIKAWQETNKDALKSIKEGTAAKLEPLNFEFEVRNGQFDTLGGRPLSTRSLLSPMTPGNTLGGSAYLPRPEFQPGINDIVRPQPIFWDYIRKGATSSASYVWVNKVKTSPAGAPGWLNPGDAKPGISFTVATEISNAKKIAASEKIAIELLDDIDGFQSWVEDELVYQVMQKASLTLMSGTASSTTPAGIQTISSPYSLTTVKTTNANNWDAIRACVAQLRSLNFTGNVTAFINPIDMANMVMTKAQNQGQQFIQPVTGAIIVEDNNVPVGYLQIAILDYYKVLIYKAFTMTYGWENDDFTKNLVTVIGEMRIHQFVSNNFLGAFIYDTFANITAALIAP